MSITEIGKQEAQAILTSKPTDSPDGYEKPEYFQLDQFPTTAVGGTAIQLRRCTHDRTDEGHLGLVLADPYVYTEGAELKDTAIFSHTETNEFTLANTEDDRTESVDGTILRPDNTGFRANQVETFREAEGFDSSTDRVVVRLTGKEGRYVGLCLDECGLQHTNIGQDSTGVPELNSDEDLFDGVPLGYEGTTVRLRPSLEKTEVILTLQHTEDVLDGYSGDSYWPTILVSESESEEDFEAVPPNVEEPIKEEYNRVFSPWNW
jgi:hypothetical protein